MLSAPANMPKMRSYASQGANILQFLAVVASNRLVVNKEGVHIFVKDWLITWCWRQQICRNC